MKKVLTYTDEEINKFQDIYTFLNELEAEFDENLELTDEREKYITAAFEAIRNLQDMLEI